MARTILVTGGCRSGKSEYARRLAEDIPGRRVFVATAKAVDEEMRRRIGKHREARRPAGWETVEEPLALAGVLDDAGPCEVVLVDCLTLWVNNLLYEAERAGSDLTEERMAGESRELLAACRRRPGTVIFVANEVGMGIVPENALSRRYRDLAGLCNRMVAAGADAVALVVCGIPMDLKGG